MNEKKKRVFSGIQPSGNVHIGNYLGAIKQFVELQDHHEAFYCIVDEHAITVPQDPEELRANILNAAILYLAAGIDPKKSTIFVQSYVPAHAELGWILNTITPLGELERMTQFKDKANRGEEVFAGLLNYPTLMAADILLYHTDVVPVGEDQVQHIELTRSLAKRFNNRFGDTFVVPEVMIKKETGRIMGLDDPTKKMSKSAPSANNYIALLDSADEIRRKVKIAVTDSSREVRYDEENKPAVSNLMHIFGAFSGHTSEEIKHAYEGKSYADFKNDLAELLVEKIMPIQQRFKELSQESGLVRDLLIEGGDHAHGIANQTLKDVQQKVGFIF